MCFQKIIHSDSSAADKLRELQEFLSSSSIRNATIDILDEKIFSAALSGARKIYFDVIKAINETLQMKSNKSVTRVKDQLNTLTNLIKCWELCISHVKALEKLSIIDIQNFTASLFEIAVDILNHCNTSEKDYGEHFQAVSDLLALVFRQCMNTLNSFYALLDTVVSIDTNQENEMKLLFNIIDMTGKIALLTSGMDAKSLTDMWKRFGKLATNYNLEMKKISTDMVAGHLKGLSENIVSMLLSVCQKNSQSSNERSVLCCRVLLKILEKLCETYHGWIRKEVMLGIVTMQAYMCRYNEQYLQIAGYKVEFIKFVQTNFTFMIDSFLEVIFKNDSFKEAFFGYQSNCTDNIVENHLLLLTIMRKISASPYETQREWYGTKNNILDVCFKNIDVLTQEICNGELRIQMSRNITQGSYLASIYEATCLNIFSLVCQISTSDFSEFVTLLLKYLLGGKFYSSLLSSDVWCFVCRLGSSELCYSHFKYLMQIYEILEERKDDLNVIMLSNLLSRQYRFISEKDKNDFISSIDETSDPHIWNSIVRVMANEEKNLSYKKICASDINVRLSKDLSNLEDNPTLKNFNQLVDDLSIIETFGIIQDSESTDIFMKMWNKIVCMMSDCEGSAACLLEKLAISLLRATNTQQQAKYATLVLESLSSVYPYTSSEFRLSICQYLERSASHLTEASDGPAVAEVFCRLFSDPEPCIQQQTFESFEYLTRACPDSGLLASVALGIRNSRSEVSRTLPAYISGQVAHSLVGFLSSREFFKALCEVAEAEERHICRVKSPSVEREEKLPKLEDETVGTRLDGERRIQDPEKLVDKVCADLELLARFKSLLKRDSCNKLSKICVNFLERRDG